MTTTNTLVPNYIDIDFDTAKTNLKNLLAVNPVFKDYNLEGANITVMIELISYLISLNTYYMNTIAKNVYPSTSNMYETTHMLAEIGGYSPSGYISSQANVTLNLSAISGSSYDVPNGEIIIDEWSLLTSSTGVTNSDGTNLTFVVTNETTSISISSALENPEINITVREGSVVRYNYKGSDIVDNRIYLPVNKYDYGDSTYFNTIRMYINGTTQWSRISNWYEEIDESTGLDNNNTFMFKYDKYEKYYIEFSNTRNIPTSTDNITILAIVSSGVDGNVGEGVINKPDNVGWLTCSINGSSSYISSDYYTLYNNNSSVGGSNPDTIDEIKNNVIGSLHSQYRNVTKNDYISHLESRSDVIKAMVWGEQEQSQFGSLLDYNNVYITIIPNEWVDGTCLTERPSAHNNNDDVLTYPCLATVYDSDYTDNISLYLKNRKILTVKENFVVPELLYISLKIGLKIKSNYTFANVMADVRDKILYYFKPANRNFNEIISFTDITEYILDTTKTSDTNAFSNIRGLRSLVVRDIGINIYDPDDPNYYVSKTIYESDEMYPYYIEPDTEYDNLNNLNILRRIQLGYNQFPLLHLDTLLFNLEN